MYDEQGNNATLRQSSQHKCPNCGAYLVYDPETQDMVCEHCNSKVDIQFNYNVNERDFVELEKAPRWSDGDNVECYRCSNCGANTVMSKGTIATACPYCGSPVVVDTEHLSYVKPDTAVPFQVTDDEARDGLLKWRKKRFLAPQDFRKHLAVDEMKGVYMPVWTFDSTTDTYYDGKLGRRRTRTVRRNGKTYTETYIDWFYVNGNIDMVFDDILIRGSNNVPEKDFSALKPFPQQLYVVYDDRYLAGYIADNYTVQPLDAYEQAKQRMRERIHSQILSMYHADVVGHLNLDVRISNRSFKYAMLPVYVTATKYRQKVFNQYISGVFGYDKQVKVSGRYPKSPWKIGALVLLGLGLLVGAYFIMRNTGAIDVDFSLLRGAKNCLTKLFFKV